MSGLGTLGGFGPDAGLPSRGSGDSDGVPFPGKLGGFGAPGDTAGCVCTRTFFAFLGGPLLIVARSNLRIEMSELVPLDSSDDSCDRASFPLDPFLTAEGGVESESLILSCVPRCGPCG